MIQQSFDLPKSKHYGDIYHYLVDVISMKPAQAAEWIETNYPELLDASFVQSPVNEVQVMDSKEHAA